MSPHHCSLAPPTDDGFQTHSRNTAIQQRQVCKKISKIAKNTLNFEGLHFSIQQTTILASQPFTAQVDFLNKLNIEIRIKNKSDPKPPKQI